MSDPAAEPLPTLRDRARRAAPHALALAAVEWALSLALGRQLTLSLASPLRNRPEGGDALFSEHGRIALDLGVARAHEINSAGALVVLALVLAALAVVPLQGALAALARGLPGNPWARSVSRTPPLVALSLLGLATWGSLALAVHASLTRLLARALSPAPGHAVAIAAAIAAVTACAALALRAVFALARASVVAGHPALASLGHGWSALRRRPLAHFFARALCELASLSLAALASFAPTSVAVSASLLAHGLRLAIDLAWLAWASRALPEPVSSH
jgi:hypothetical protein